MSALGGVDVLLSIPVAPQLDGTEGARVTPNDIIQATTARFAARAAHRQEVESKLRTGSPLTADTPARVQKRIEHLAVTEMAKAAVSAATAPATLSFEGLAAPPAPPTVAAATIGLERILGTNELMSVTFLELAVQVARTVGRVQIRSGAGAIRGFGTGFMVAPRLLLTNNHVLASPVDARTSRIEFNFQDGINGATPASSLFELDPDAFFATDRELDYSLVAVRDAGGTLSAFGFNRLIEQEGKVLVGECLNIIQHPNGEPKQLALRENKLVDVLPQFLHYHTDTAPGSSGSPVFNDQWEVVGLHHSGVPKRDEQGRILTADGQIWTQVLGEHRIAWLANEGARISQVLTHIKSIAGLGSGQRTLRDSVFSAASPVGAASAGTSVPLPPHGSEVGAPVMAQDGTATWTIPLQVSVRLGGAFSTAAPSGAPSIHTRPSTPEGPPTPPPPSPPPAGLDEALAEARAARSRPYYDETADTAAAREYYGDIDEHAGGSQLFQALNDLLTSTHTPKPSYKPAQHVYPFVDLHRDGKIRSIYSQKTFDAEELIREDFAIEQQRAVRRRELVLAETAISREALEQAEDLLEAELPFNCEHVVPQSWFTKKEPMRGDLHHLFACEIGCNSFRGNIPYFDFPDFEEAIRDECGKRDDNRFEPGAAKGIVARATLYFLLRYPQQVNAEMATYDEGRLATLLSWHASHPVNEYERHRNMAIAEKQGNRNPLIDRPEWAVRIDFSSGL